MYPLKIQGKLIEFPNKADADAWLRDFLSASDTPGRKTNGAAASNDNTFARIVRDFLKVIVSSGERGISTDRVLRAVGKSSPQAWGNRGKNINRFLRHMGFEWTEVYSNERNAEGVREWKAGPKAQIALEEVSKIIGAT